jgi:hypothetical protein
MRVIKSRRMSWAGQVKLKKEEMRAAFGGET